MNDAALQLKFAPIVEAVLDIDCDMPPASDLTSLEATARDALRDQYPKSRSQFFQETQVEAKSAEAPKVTTRQGIQALQFLHEDEKQLVQVRPQGYSFNRLAPYSSLDDYLPEIERTWRLFVGLASPVQVRMVRLRYINRLLLPMNEGRVDLDKYLRQAPHLPDEKNLTFSGFFNQHSAMEPATGNLVNIITALQQPNAEKLPIILDIEAVRSGNIEPSEWPEIAKRIHALRALKNLVFKNSLTKRCLNLFQH